MTSRLYRTAGALTTTRPLFTVTSGTRSWTDSAIRSIVITHGKRDPTGGLHPATAEVEVAGAVGILHDRDVSIRLADGAATALAGTTAAAPRFTGRVATQQVTTRARRGRGPAHSSVLRCSSWSSLYLAAQRSPIIGSPDNLREALQRMFDRSVTWVGKTIPLTFSGDFSPWIYDSAYTETFSEQLRKYFTETGHLLRQRRDGGVQALTLQYRADAGETAAASWWPITLGHAVSGVEHEQHTDVANIGVRLRWREPDGAWPATVVKSVNWAWRGSDDGVPAESVADWIEMDWTHTVWTTEQYRHAINALSLQTFRVAFSTPTLTIDLLTLARSPRDYDRTLLRQLLRLEQGDPVIFGGDWSAQWNGIYYAEQITETITPDRWTIELGLYPPQEVTGHYGRGGDPTIPARIWSQATAPWSTGTTNWS